jgi:hypothetical protein
VSTRHGTAIPSTSLTLVPSFSSTTRTIGQTIEAAGSFTSNKQIAAVAIKEYRVEREGLSGFWSMWTAAGNSATSGASVIGTITQVGTNTQFFKDVSSSSSGKSWSISTSFTPNIRIFSTVTSLTTVASRSDYLITLPNDKGLVGCESRKSCRLRYFIC